ncbi:type I polyketide synthase [Tengunoibacter tsumagoiensis]|uniref:Polyketide synthase n=1 Tax=Tengunoibacter tsumagoiensis TaxID=2014871 RepID=A0A402A9G8_9CHLR|nr:type I polyketide synthase [Tengunoibacter tsumagoiensis]GCE15769.1 hypothetical protein KTT_56280 [Tengunoibacter tsumagoiensis]
MSNSELFDAQDDSADIAIIGMAGRFPGANSVDAFWQNLRDGVESITHFSDDELLEAGVDPELLQDPSYVKAGAVLDGVDQFDASFFGLTPKEAEIMDPQQRLFLETAWEVLESAGYDPERYSGPIGIYAGSGLSTYLLNNIYPNQEVLEDAGQVQVVLGNDKDSLTTRVAYLLNLTGPSYAVQTYCSTSLVAVSIACSSLLSGDCDMALAGGVAVSVPQKAGYSYQEGGISSPDARCRAFDAHANGAPLGSGVGAVLLKRLEDARADGDTIHAVIKGSAINNDGALKVGFTAPGVRGQAGVILEALANADVSAETIDYLEAHGTGTPLGDAVELTAILKAFREHTDKTQFCALGSAKTNVGHLDRAAGVTGLIKTVQALKHKQIPPSLNYTAPNPQVDLVESPFFVNTQLREWKSDARKPRRAGVSAFGLGGTNAHVIVEEAPVQPANPGKQKQHLLLLSAKSQDALEQATTNLLYHLDQTPEIEMADVAYTLQVGRRVFSHRRLLVCRDRADAIQALTAETSSRLYDSVPQQLNRPVSFLFAGVGEQYVGLARELYEQVSEFQQIVDQCCDLARPWLGLDLRTLLFPAETAASKKAAALDLRALLGRSDAVAPQNEQEQLLQQTQYAQPAIFILEYALAQVLISKGIRPQSLLGYSLGEYVAAAVAGVFTLPAALQLVCRRGQLIASLPSSSMLAVALSVEQIQPYLSDQIDLAIINSAQQCVLAGSTEAIARLEEHLQNLQISSRRLQTSHAFHSAQMEPIRHELTQLVASFSLQVPQIPYLSNVTGTWITEQQALDPHYWGRHLCETVQFAQGVEQLWEQGQPVLLEIGPGQSLASFAHQQLRASSTQDLPLTIIPTLRARLERRSDLTVLLESIGRLWLADVAVDWGHFWGGERRRRIPLPTYPFQRQRHWIEAPRSVRSASVQVANVAQKNGKSPDPADWFYLPGWKESVLPPASLSTDHPWLLLQDAGGRMEQIAQRLEQRGLSLIRVQSGEHFEQIDERSYRLPIGQREAFIALGQKLRAQGLRPSHVLHGWSLDTVRTTPLNQESFRASQELGLYSLLWLVQGLEQVIADEAIQISVLTNQTQPVSGSEQLFSEHAALVAASKVLAQEQLNFSVRVIDSHLLDGEPATGLWLNQMLAEVSSPVTEPVVVYRGEKRYIQQYLPTKIPAPSDHSKLRQRGTYLITGGLGGVGLVLAEYLARTVQARLVLVGRSGLPLREQWQQWLNEHSETERISQQIRQIQALETLGAEVLVLKVDVANVDQVKQAIQQTYNHFGALHGVIHAAGYTARTAFAPIQETDVALFEAHFQSKVYGLLSLSEALAGQKLDFCLLFSSLSAVLGGLGFTAYTAANGFMDAYAAAYKLEQPEQTPWLSVNWDTWLVPGVIEQGVGSSVAAYAMSPAEGIEAFTRVLHTNEWTRVVHSTGDLQARINQWLTVQSQVIEDQPSVKPGLLLNDDYEQQIIEIWKKVLGVESVGLHDNFFDIGGNSLMGLQVLARIKKSFKVQIPAVALFEAPTVSALASYLRPATPVVPTAQQDLLEQRRKQARQQTGTEGIAIIGMAGRFPGASSIQQFWENLRNGVESITFFSDEELLEVGIAPEMLQMPNFVKARPILQGVEDFDAGFFGYSPREVELMDPQHRLFLESSWEALEHAGYDSFSYEGLIGVFGGTNISTYMLGLMRRPDLVGTVNDYQMVIGNDKDSLTTGVSYKLNLKGPSFAVQTFCSTSLVATHLACRSLLNGECDMTLAGGVSVRVPYKSGHIYQEGGQESPDGHCRTFDAQAHGSMFGDGVGVIVLKRLSDALADGDTIHAVIKGSAINNDGSLKVSYTAPSVIGQAQVVSTALQVAGVSADSISYIEAHGTATELGDPIEVASLTRAFRQQTDQVGYCAIGSVKTNIGHLDRAAGVSGLLKTVLALKHEQIPASLHYEAPNPEIDFETSPFFVNASLRPWPRSTAPRRAGVNSLGMGGTNVHVVVEEAPIQPATGPSRPWQLLPLSARTPEALAQARTNLHTALTQGTDPLADVAYTLQRGRHRFEYRNLVLARSTEDAITLLEATGSDGKQQWSLMGDDKERPVAWLFAGVGEQYVGMGRALYQAEPLFQQIVDQGAELARPWLELDLRTLLFPTGEEATTTAGLDLRALLGRNGATAAPQSESEQRLQQTQYAQPAVFLIEYALAQLLLSWGIRPQALLGYSLGEYVAAAVAGVLSLPDALHLVCRRAQLIASLPESRLLAVALGQAEVTPYLSEEIDLAIINSPQQCVLAGTIEAIAELEARLSEQGISHRRVQTSHAFHSRQLAGIRDELNELAAGFSVQLPSIPYISNVTGDWISEQELFDGEYWGRHLCETVHFARGIQTLWEQGNPLLMEIGAGHSLGSFVHQQISATSESEPGATVITTLRARQERQEDQAVLLAAVGKLWLAGGTIDWSQFWSKEIRRRIPLPTYPFQRQRYWIDVTHAAPAKPVAEAPTSAEAALSSLKKEELSDWFYVPGWKQTSPHLPPIGKGAVLQSQNWLIFTDDSGLGEALHVQLQQQQQQVSIVRPGSAFQVDGTQYRIQPKSRTDYEALCKHLRDQGTFPERIVHLWSVSREALDPTNALEQGFHSLLLLTQVLGELRPEACEIAIISNDVQSVIGNERINPAKAAIIGPYRVIPLEYPTLSTRTIDLVLPTNQHQQNLLHRQLIGELLAPNEQTLVALRGQHRWVQTFEPLQLTDAYEETVPLREKGTYLITGGLGGIGLGLAHYLAERVQARLVLISRTALPPRGEWPAIIANHDDNQTVSRQIRQLLQIEEYGSEVLIVPADVANEAQMRQAVQQAQELFGTLHGVIHAAGVPGIGLMQLKSSHQAEQVMAPKVQGTYILERVLQGIDLDFLVLFSSITSATGGGPGQVDYCAANAFLDAYAQQNALRHGRTIAINWGEWQWNAWQQGLSGYDIDAQTFFKQHRQRFGIPFNDGSRAMSRILASGLSQVVVSTQDFRAIVQLSSAFTAATMLQKARQGTQARPVHSRPALATSYVAPRNEMEQRVTAVWQEVLGVSQIGIHDNFFELGGNSLVGIDLITRLKQELTIDVIPSYVLYEAPSVGAMTQFLTQNKSSVAVEDRQDRGEKRRESLKHRMRDSRPSRTK